MKWIFLLVTLASCSMRVKNEAKSSILLIHGSHLDGESWRLVENELSGSFNVVAPSIPDRARQEVLSLKDTASEFCGRTASPSIIVAHSYGGAVANQMVSLCPEKIKKIIYVAAVSPRNKERSFDGLSKVDEKNYSSIVTYGEKWITPKERTSFMRVMAGVEKIDGMFQSYPESVSLGSDLLEVDNTVLKKIPKAYVYTQKDVIFGLATQVKYVQRDKISRVITLPSGHLPMITHPKELARSIASLSRN